MVVLFFCLFGLGSLLNMGLVMEVVESVWKSGFSFYIVVGYMDDILLLFGFCSYDVFDDFFISLMLLVSKVFFNVMVFWFILFVLMFISEEVRLVDFGLSVKFLFVMVENLLLVLLFFSSIFGVCEVKFVLDFWRFFINFSIYLFELLFSIFWGNIRLVSSLFDFLWLFSEELEMDEGFENGLFFSYWTFLRYMDILMFFVVVFWFFGFSS